ncbi:hypothetical protein MPTK1_2g25370 [Marchantia polymorpha subsp. ruderalis]|uniref:Uncharacterized protein n=1 Tax=Marchantia polymorpha TaxID=3197 RepID=A0A2R6XBG5_MARPO|nr:hypothetical protein MARPO_0025s0141 [Marchantia polymorpha]BBN03671.1 hypothetical protein Mp_2g25370 [Marchantia polymorpha subsp. ruderalis]|eukprot:PTQ43461.1 hypothetical protein MARPO_0025s0141 [Marchantia polymorpha]
MSCFSSEKRCSSRDGPKYKSTYCCGSSSLHRSLAFRFLSSFGSAGLTQVYQHLRMKITSSILRHVFKFLYGVNNDMKMSGLLDLRELACLDEAKHPMLLRPTACL